MLRREKSAVHCHMQKDRVVYDSFALFESEDKGALVASESKNCDCHDGVLRGGFGCTHYLRADGKPFQLPNSMPDVEAYLFYVQKNDDGSYTDAFGCVTRAGTAFTYSEEEFTFKGLQGFWGRMKPISIIDGDGVIRTAFVGHDGIMFYTKTEGLTRTEIKKALPIVCQLKDRLFFAVEPFTVGYSAPLSPKELAESVDDGGRISLPRDTGKIVGLVAFGECVMIFYEFGISKLTPAGSAREFQVETVAYDGALILQDSMCACGNKIFFLTRTGMYVYDGKRARSVCQNLPLFPREKNQICKSAVSDGHYFLQFYSTEDKKTDIIVHGESEKGYISFKTKDLCNLRGHSVVFYNASLYALRENVDLPDGEKRSFIVNDCNFGVDGVKTIKRIRFVGSGNITVEISNGLRKKQAVLAMDKGFADMRLPMRGENFSLSICLETGALVRSVEVELVRLKGVK